MRFERHGQIAEFSLDKFYRTEHVETVVLMSRGAVRSVDERFARTGAEAKTNRDSRQKAYTIDKVNCPRYRNALVSISAFSNKGF